MNFYWEKIEKLVESLDKDSAALIQQVSKVRTFAKGEFLLSEGQICRHFYNIIEGIARKYYLKDGKEITTEIYFPHDVAITLNSFSLNIPCKESIQALTAVKALQIEREGYTAIRVSSQKLMEFDIRISELYAMWLEERLFQFQSLSATERYQKLLKNYPDLFLKIPLTIIASYLGISLETLSRIRAKYRTII